MRNNLSQFIATGAESLVALTSDVTSCFFGFYDICPWSQIADEVVLLTCPRDFLQMPIGHAAKVAIWSPKTGELKEIAETTGWNWQHGARQRWLRDGNILFNDVSQGVQISRLVNRMGKVLSEFEMSVSALHPSETYGVSANYAKLASEYSAYGYGSAKNSHIPDRPDSDGLWHSNLVTGKVSLLLSYKDICERLSIKFQVGMFVTHPDFSPSGNLLEFFLIHNTGGGTSSMRLLVLDISSNNLTCVSSEKVSHPAWISDSELWYWARESSAMRMLSSSGIMRIPGIGVAARLFRKIQGRSRNALLSEGFYISNPCMLGEKRQISPSRLPEDGHFSRHPTQRVMLGDTYPDDRGYLTLFLFSLDSEKIVEIARIFHGVRSSELALRCDLHPRWNRDGSEISVDVSIDGIRHMAVFDATSALTKLQAG